MHTGPRQSPFLLLIASEHRAAVCLFSHPAVEPTYGGMARLS